MIDAVPYNYRISYKIAQLCIIILSCSNSRSGCSLIKIHIVSNALNNDSYMEKLESILDKQRKEIIVRFDPAVDRGIKYAMADGLLEQLKSGTYKLTEKGKEYANSIYQDSVMLREKRKLNKIGRRLTNDIIDEIMSMWR